MFKDFFLNSDYNTYVIKVYNGFICEKLYFLHESMHKFIHRSRIVIKMYMFIHQSRIFIQKLKKKNWGAFKKPLLLLKSKKCYIFTHVRVCVCVRVWVCARASEYVGVGVDARALARACASIALLSSIQRDAILPSVTSGSTIYFDIISITARFLGKSYRT